MDTLLDLPRITGTEVNYCLVCRRKLWFFTHQVTMEHTSQKVEIGKIIHEESFRRENKELLIDDTISIDFSGKELTIHETKSTGAMDEASRYQLLYYIYYLEKKGIEGVRGTVHYYKNKTTEKIELTDDDRKKLDSIIYSIEQARRSSLPPAAEKMKICRKCSYYELCFC